MDEKQEMTMEREGGILERAVQVFGPEPQIDMMIEEMSELTKALLKYRRACSADDTDRVILLECVLEELADVQIMLNQMTLIFGDFTEWEIAKLERLERLLNWELIADRVSINHYREFYNPQCDR